MTSDRSPATDTLHVRGPADLVHAVPYLLGFHPVASLVVVGLAHGQVAVTMRIDLADLAEPAGATGLADALAALRRGGAVDYVGLIYDDTAPPGIRRPLPWAGLATALRETAAPGAGGRVQDVLLVSAGRWWSYCCTSTACCPIGGRELHPDESSVPAAATFAGLVALPDRNALAALLAPVSDPERAALAPHLAAAESAMARAAVDGTRRRHEGSVKRALFAAARVASGPHDRLGDQLDDAVVARFGVGLRVIAVRDSVWTAIDDGRLDNCELWRALARRLPAPYDAAPLFLFGWASWRTGNGALAGIATERAIGSDPNYSAADLLHAALAHAVDPRRLPRLRLSRSA